MMAPPVTPDPVVAAFKAAMRRVAATVNIVTASDGERLHGMTATAVTSVSMDPPSLLVCVNNRTLMHAVMSRAERFCVNVLHQDQAEHSAAFSGAVPPDERFSVGAWDRTTDGLGVLTDAQANIFCRRVAAIPYGTHTIFIGQVIDAAVRDPIAPLVYQDAHYCVPVPA